MSGSAMLDPLSQTKNILGVNNLLQVCVEQSICNLIYTSTYNVVFGGQVIENGTEDLPYFPIDQHTDYYSSSKAMAEQLILSHNGCVVSNGCHMHTLVIRPAAIYGEDEQRHFPRIIRMMDYGLFFFTFGNATVDWVHVSNLVQAFVLATDKLLLIQDTAVYSTPPCGRAYCISDNSPINSWDFLAPLTRELLCPFPSLVIIPLPIMLYLAYAFEMLHILVKQSTGIIIEPFLTRAEVYKVGATHYFSMQRAMHELGYSPTLSTKERAQKVAAYYGKKITNADYFRTPSISWWVLIVFGLFHLFILAFTEYSISNTKYAIFILQPLESIGLVLFRSHYGMQLVFYVAILAHVVETILTMYAMRGRGYRNTWLLWMVQTLMLGGPSMNLILARNAAMDLILARNSAMDAKTSSKGS